MPAVATSADWMVDVKVGWKAALMDGSMDTLMDASLAVDLAYWRVGLMVGLKVASTVVLSVYSMVDVTVGQ